MAAPLDWKAIRCGVCRIQVASLEDLIAIIWPGGICTRLFNVISVNPHQSRIGGTVADTYCVQCGCVLGWRFIEITQRHFIYRAGRYLLRLDKLRYSFHENADQDEGANGQNADQYGVANEQDLGVNEQNADQDGGNNQQVPNEQNLGANEQNANQDGGNNQQVPNEQDLGANGQNADQNGGGNEQNDDDEDGGRPTKRRKME